MVTVLDAEFYVLGEGLGFLLRKAGHDRDQNFSLGVHRVDVLLFKPDGDVLFLQLPDVFEAV